MKNTVTLSVNDGTQMNAYVSAPGGAGEYPGIILFQEAYGVNRHIRNVADRLAAEGYVVIAPEIFHRTAPPGFESPYGDFSAVMPHFQAITVETIVADAKACYDWLVLQNEVKKEAIGCIGFCLGGRAAFIANTALPLAASVSYYGGGMNIVSNLAERLRVRN